MRVLCDYAQSVAIRIESARQLEPRSLPEGSGYVIESGDLDALAEYITAAADLRWMIDLTRFSTDSSLTSETRLEAIAQLESALSSGGSTRLVRVLAMLPVPPDWDLAGAEELAAAHHRASSVIRDLAKRRDDTQSGSLSVLSRVPSSNADLHAAPADQDGVERRSEPTPVTPPQLKLPKGTRAKKDRAIKEMREAFHGSRAVVLTEYRGLTVRDLRALRRSLGEDATYVITESGIASTAAHEAGIQGLGDQFTGPTAIAFIRGDVATAARGLRDFAKANPLLVIKGGVLGGWVMDADSVKAILALERREDLLAKLAGDMRAVLATPARLLVELVASPVNPTVSHPRGTRPQSVLGFQSLPSRPKPNLAELSTAITDLDDSDIYWFAKLFELPLGIAPGAPSRIEKLAAQADKGDLPTQRRMAGLLTGHGRID